MPMSDPSDPIYGASNDNSAAKLRNTVYYSRGQKTNWMGQPILQQNQGDGRASDFYNFGNQGAQLSRAQATGGSSKFVPLG
jgi:hypothetical protein